MKTTVEINGYFIDVEEKDGLISVSATFEDEVVEEFSIEVEEGQDSQEDSQEEVQGFDEFDQEEEEDFSEEEEEEVEGQLESFQSFINKKK